MSLGLCDSACSHSPAAGIVAPYMRHSPSTAIHGVPAPSRARENKIAPSKLLGAQHGERLDTGAAGAAIGSDQAMAPVGTIDGTANGRG